jgi:5'-nucleotidase
MKRLIFRRAIFRRRLTHYFGFSFLKYNALLHFCKKKFDEGDAGLAKFLTALKTEANASSTCDEMPAVLGGNIVPHSESALLEPDVPDIEAYSVFTMSDGEEVGVIGITVARKTMESSQPDEGTFLLDEKETTAAAVEELTAMGVNKIIVITHIGMQNDIEWLGSLEGVDVVVGGDSHSLLGDNATAVIGSTRGSYATVVEKPDGTLTCIVQAWDYSKLVGNLDVDFDEDGNVISCTGSPVFPFNPDTVVVRDADPRYDMSAEDAAAVIASLVEKTEGQARPFEADADALADMEVYGLELEELTQAVVGTVSAPIGLEGAPYESGACDLVAQSFILNPLATADVAIQNRGGCRSSIDEVSLLKNSRLSFA